MLQSIKVLIVEDSAPDAELVLDELRRAGFDPEWKQVDNEADFLRHMDKAFDVVISDFRIPGFGGMRALELLRQLRKEVPFILISGAIGEDLAVAAIKSGADDYLIKDRLGRLGNAVTQARERHRLRVERHELDQSLRASLLLFRSTLENLIEGCQIIGRDWRYLYVNAVAARHAQRSVSELSGRTMFECFPGIEATGMFQALRQCMAEGSPRQMDNEFRRADGTSTWFHLFIQPLPEGLFVLSLDISARKEAERALQTSEARFRDMLKNVQLIAITLDAQGLVTFCNEHLLRVSGWQRDDVIGASWFDMFLPADEADVKKLFFDNIRQGSVASHWENKIKTKVGELRDVVWNNTLLRDSDGVIVGTASIGDDVTEKNRAGAQIRAQLDELRRWHDITLGREERMLALKGEVNDLLAEQGKPTRYSL